MNDVQTTVYKRLLCSICIEEGSYMDQHNTPSSMLQEIRGATNSRRSTLQHRKIRDGGAESETKFHLLNTIFPTSTHQYNHPEALRQGSFTGNLALSPLSPEEPDKKGRSPLSPPFVGSGCLMPAYFITTIFLVCTKPPA